MYKVRNANYPLVVKKSRIEGEGVFAAKAIPWGVKMIEFQGAVSPMPKLPNGRRTAPPPSRNSATISISVCSLPGNGAALINHSRRYANRCVLREGRKVWIIAGIQG